MIPHQRILCELREGLSRFGGRILCERFEKDKLEICGVHVGSQTSRHKIAFRSLFLWEECRVRPEIKVFGDF